MNKLKEWWKGLSLWERVAWCLIVVCLLIWLTCNTLVAAIWPREAVIASWQRLGLKNVLRDPWGRDWGWGYFGSEYQVLFAYSFGVNGIDEEGLGDDILTDQMASQSQLPIGQKIVSFQFPNRIEKPPKTLLLLIAWARELLASGAILLLWSVAPWVRASRSPELSRELARAAWLASLPTAVLVGGLWWLGQEFGWTLPEREESLLVVPVTIAVGGTLVLLCFLLALWIRLRRPLEESAASSS